MDPISQAALGAIAARAAAPLTLIGPVLLVGALAGAMPDIDVIFSPGGDFFDTLRSHRGITHSVFFALTAGPLLGWLFSRWWVRRAGASGGGAAAGTAVGWMLAITAAVLSHPLLDALTPYGTQLLQPFSDQRIAIHAMPIIDPLYTGLLLLGILIARRSDVPKRIASITLLVTCGYLAFAWQLGVAARDFARADLESLGVKVDRIEAFPTLLQPWQRQVVARTPERDLLGRMTMWSPCPPVWTGGASYTGPEVAALRADEDGETFVWFAMDWVHYSKEAAADGERLVVSDLRYALEGDPAISVFAVAALIDGEGDHAKVSGPVYPLAGRTTDPSRLTAALANVFTPVCRSPQVAEGQGG